METVALGKTKKNLYIFDLDNTLVKDQTLNTRSHPNPDGNPEFAKDGQWNDIKKLMKRAIDEGDEIWILTANYRSTIEHIREKLFGTNESDSLVQHAKIFDGNHIRIRLGINENDRNELLTINDQGRKAEFVLKEIQTAREDLHNKILCCNLFDDSYLHAKKCNEAVENFLPNKDFSITIHGHRVVDFVDDDNTIPVYSHTDNAYKSKKITDLPGYDSNLRGNKLFNVFHSIVSIKRSAISLINSIKPKGEVDDDNKLPSSLNLTRI